MLKNATNFIRNRKKVVAITCDRIKYLLWYVVECYQILLKDEPTYSKTVVKKDTTLHFEDYLKMELVDEYLIPNKRLVSSRCSELENINFHYENQARYTDISDKKQKPDKIDIYINKLGLQTSWNQEEENIYFVLECKRITILSDCKTYIEDTQKFADRNYNNLRLPFEGQLAFIENKKLNSISVSNEINNRLKLSPTLITTQFLKSQIVNKSFNGCYFSIHKRNYNKKEPFTIFHLFFDYSKVVIN